MVRFFTFLFTLFTLNSFAFAGLFLVGNNVFGDPGVIIVDPGDDGAGGITCAGPGKDWGDCLYCMRTHVYDPVFGSSYCYSCEWIGIMEYHCAFSCSEGCMSA
ncbi:MAG: hypothetical protein ACOCVN_02125 [bacterium]